MSGGEAHVENSIWMRAVLMGSTFLVIGILAFATMGVGVANMRHHAYEEAVHEYDDAKHDYERQNSAMRMRKQHASTEEIAALKATKDSLKDIRMMHTITKLKHTFPTSLGELPELQFS
jgi:hypothetical protein